MKNVPILTLLTGTVLANGRMSGSIIIPPPPLYSPPPQDVPIDVPIDVPNPPIGTTNNMDQVGYADYGGGVQPPPVSIRLTNTVGGGKQEMVPDQLLSLLTANVANKGPPLIGPFISGRMAPAEIISDAENALRAAVVGARGGAIGGGNGGRGHGRGKGFGVDSSFGVTKVNVNPDPHGDVIRVNAIAIEISGNDIPVEQIVMQLPVPSDPFILPSSQPSNQPVNSNSNVYPITNTDIGIILATTTEQEEPIIGESEEVGSITGGIIGSAGGLGLLVASGLGYAVHKRSKDDEDVIDGVSDDCEVANMSMVIENDNSLWG